MTSIVVIQCDNPDCSSQTPKDDKEEGWIQLTSYMSGDIYDGDAICMSEIMQFENYIIPQQADFCCLGCFLKVTGLK